MSPYNGTNRRAFYRVDIRGPVKFRAIQKTGENIKLATSRNISRSGILFNTPIVPKLSTVLWMDLDLIALKMCRDIEDNALTYQKGVLGRVVRVEEDQAKNQYQVSVCFITEKNSKDNKTTLRELLSKHS